MDKEKMIALIRELSQANGAPGFEDEVVRILRRRCEGLGEIREDSLRNLYVRRKENRGNPAVLLDAHTDEVAFMVQHICADGTLKFIPLGGWVPACVSAHPVRVHTSKGYIPGIVASKPPHYMSEAERTAVPKLADMVIDVGAVSKEDAVKNFGVRIGEPVVPDTPFQHLKDHDLLYGKAFDCRIGCAAAVAVLEALEGTVLPADAVGVFTAQEETGIRGARVAANTVKPAAAILFEGSPADDTFSNPETAQTALKKGPMLRHIDAGMITNPRFQRLALTIGEELGIPVQQGVRTGGSTNGAYIHISNQGVPVIVIGLPVRYAHTHCCFTAYQDFEHAVKLAVAVIKRLTPDIIAGF
ncbi:MAG: M20/M25/M40 family metallo-hydrolase [Spirochaetaceae bacterium]|jgi:putative aminopeptidase FrvX|nr:M20/M25/M40 family metallo-hydrolase [Spirochaetaceae bacterium]